MLACNDLSISLCDWFTASMSPWLHINRSLVVRHLLTYPKFAFKIEGIQQFDDVIVVAGGQNVNLHHIILQLILCLCVDYLGSSKCPVLLVLGLKVRVNKRKKLVMSSEYSAFKIGEREKKT